ncbi:maleylacetoacetate isomerase [Phenylobacterium sp. Root77]|jgi:maleylacetoacetate isomerase|uniref:maleylacetoacetate isomerase n=1 Tax=unclassified Phenylobacterium TaxID=2640670 RepID=UPI0007003D73|nr:MULTISPECIES: maleylacetoacetate isomerase [unclassified Phenylobacterium]KQW73479.1 maleylacetoacetate isomerase [Phenylobacterium sp. Root1277]KQW92698.1 maleylacetoacetate isomerase [Phenylobacterium sp. Root1290]KRC40926.1 maleylacetoacetate isomerase [Phenylobacterium sp. Root77]
MSLTLHSYWRATAPYRVRIGLNLKGLDYGYVGVNLLKGEQHADDYVTKRNRQHLTPALEADGHVLVQSLAILEWLEETHPQPALLPADAFDRATVRAMAAIVACDIHPLNNMRIQKALEQAGVDEAGRLEWSQRWIVDGFSALEPMVARHGQGFAFGAAPTLADCCLVPQVYSAQRYKVDLSPFPAIAAAAAHAGEHPAFAAAHPDRQPDAVHA